MCVEVIGIAAAVRLLCRRVPCLLTEYVLRDSAALMGDKMDGWCRSESQFRDTHWHVQSPSNLIWLAWSSQQGLMISQT